MWKFRQLSLLALIFLGFAPPSGAVVVADLFTARLTVADQSDAVRRRALGQGLSDVLVKLTGSRTVLQDPGVREVINRAQHYVVAYSYNAVAQQAVLEGGAEALEEELGQPASVSLELKFAAAPIEALLRELYLPIWPADRPPLAVWLVTRGEGGYSFVDPVAQPALVDHVQTALLRRGVAFELPLYDLQDHLAVTPEQAWTGSDEDLSQASRRYGAGSWVVLALDMTSTRPLGKWLLGDSSGLQRGNTVATTVANLLASAVDEVVDRYAPPLTYRAGQVGESLSLVISNVRNYKDFTAVTALLESLEVVVTAAVQRVDGDLLFLDLVTEGDSQVLLRALDKNSHLVQVVDMAQASGSAAHFRWQDELR